MEGYEITRLILLRAVAGLYLIGFLNAANQYLALLGSRGLEPVADLKLGRSFRTHPSLFWLDHSDRILTTCAWLGVVLALSALTGIAQSLGWVPFLAVWIGMWALYMSFVNLGGIFYSFGWEIMLLELGFLCCFLGPDTVQAPEAVMWLIRWMLFRTMFGAGLIKLRGDSCWWKLTCLYYHYETQPIPNPLSWYFHHLPKWIHRQGVLYNHFVELIVPFGFFLPSPIREIAAGFTILFQFILIMSGNLSFLNYLTIALCIPLFDNSFWITWLGFQPVSPLSTSPAHQFAIAGLVVMVIAMSVPVVLNLLSPRQSMNRAYNALHLVNSYGAFGSVTKQRMELVVEGTYGNPGDDNEQWRAYEFKGKPTDPTRAPCLMSPYHFRLDWLMWFAAMGEFTQSPWAVTLCQRLLEGDKRLLRLLAHNPFPDRPPRAVRVRKYVYRFTQPGEKGWWERSFANTFLPPLAIKGNKIVPAD